MLSQQGRRRADAGLALAELDRGIDHLDLAAARVVHLDDHAAGEGVLVGQRALDVVDGRVGQAAPLKGVEPLLGGPGRGDVLDQGLQLDAVGDAAGVDDVLGVCLPFWAAEAVAQDAEESVVAAAEEDVSVEGAEGLVWDD